MKEKLLNMMNNTIKSIILIFIIIGFALIVTSPIWCTVTIIKSHQCKAQIIELKQLVDSINHKLDERTYILELTKALSEKRDILDIQIP